LSGFRIIRRREDMSPRGYLELTVQEDGDIIVAANADPDQGFPGSVEFCIPMTGGGASPHTHRALQQLADAMDRDNKGIRPRSRPMGLALEELIDSVEEELRAEEQGLEELGLTIHDKTTIKVSLPAGLIRDALVEMGRLNLREETPGDV
jgi:hypothetical protein